MLTKNRKKKINIEKIIEALGEIYDEISLLKYYEKDEMLIKIFREQLIALQTILVNLQDPLVKYL